MPRKRRKLAIFDLKEQLDHVTLYIFQHMQQYITGDTERHLLHYSLLHLIVDLASASWIMFLSSTRYLNGIRKITMDVRLV